MKKSFVKIVALITMSILIVSNVSIFATENTFRGNDKHKQSNQLKEYVREGEITDIHPNNIVIGEKSNKVIFRITKSTSIKDEKQNEIKLSDLKVGANVEVTYNKTSNGKDKSLEAKSIQISKSVNEISNAVVQKISAEANDTLILTILYKLTDSNKKIVENTMNLVVDNNTQIVNQFGVKTVKSALKTGMVLDIEHSKAVTKGKTIQAYCNSIDIVKEYKDSETKEANIIEKNIYNDIAYLLIGNPEKVNEQIKLVLSDKTMLKDQDGNNITYEQLKVGQKIRAEYSLAMTRSLPAQAQAYSIQIINEKTVPSIENATIEDINIRNNNITVIYDVVHDNKIYEETIILLVDNNTVIRNEFEKTIAITDLKVGMLINAKHSEAVTLGIPPTAKAHSIYVVDNNQSLLIENAKINNVDTKNSRITVTYEDKFNNKIYTEMILLFDNNTIIKDSTGKSLTLKDLKVGMIIDATHSQAVTYSMPPMSLAYSINVKSSTNLPIDNEFKDFYDLLDKLFKELGVNNWYECIKDKKINWYFNDDGDLEDIIEEIVEHVLGDDYDEDDDMEDKVENLIKELTKEFKGIDKNFKCNKDKKN